MMKTLTNKITIEISTFSHKNNVSSDECSHELEQQSWLTFKAMIERTYNQLFRLHVALFILFAIHLC